MSTFQKIYLGHLDGLQSRAEKVGLSLTSLCKKAGISRATPDRWRAKPPKSVALMDQLEAAVIEAERAQA